VWSSWLDVLSLGQRRHRQRIADTVTATARGARHLTVLTRRRAEHFATGTPPLDSYDRRGRLRDGTHDEILDNVYQACTSDRSAGRDSLLLAPAGETATLFRGSRDSQSPPSSG